MDSQKRLGEIGAGLLWASLLCLGSCGSPEAISVDQGTAHQHRDALKWFYVSPAEYAPKTSGSSFIALLDKTGLFEPSGAEANNVDGVVRITIPFEISGRSISATAYAEFLNDHLSEADRYLTANVHSDDQGQYTPNIVQENGVFVPLAGRGRDALYGATYEGAVAYCTWLSLGTGDEYRLPTESEWIIADQQLNFVVERDSRRTDFEVTNWTSDLYSRDLSAITAVPNSRGPISPAGTDGDRVRRVVRIPESAIEDARSWGIETDGSGFRIVRVTQTAED